MAGSGTQSHRTVRNWEMHALGYILPDLRGNANTDFPVFTKKLCFAFRNTAKGAQQTPRCRETASKLADDGFDS
jgi:hypothetical protein